MLKYSYDGAFRRETVQCSTRRNNFGGALKMKLTRRTLPRAYRCVRKEAKTSTIEPLISGAYLTLRHEMHPRAENHAKTHPSNICCRDAFIISMTET